MFLHFFTFLDHFSVFKAFTYVTGYEHSTCFIIDTTVLLIFLFCDALERENAYISPHFLRVFEVSDFFFLLQRNKAFFFDINSNSEFKGPTKQMKAMKIESFGGKVCSCDKIEDIVRESERKSKSVGAGESKEEWPWLETKQVSRPSQGPY